MRYVRRFADDVIQKRLRSSGAVLVEGTKGCGKTETASQIARSSIRFDTDESVGVRMQVEPRSILEGEKPRLIDEWQLYPKIWNHIRHEIDDQRAKGLFILTGSATPRDDDDVKRHSGAGRFSPVRMRTMSFFERGWSSGEVSLEGIVHGGAAKSDSVDFSLKGLAGKIILGGWPALIDADVEDALQYLQDYIALISEVDISRVSNRKRDPIKVRRLLQSYARNIATTVSVTSLAKDTGGSDTTISDETIADYLDALEQLMAIEQLPAWSTHIRSRSTLRKSPKRHFVDPSLAIGALGLSADRLLADLRYLGFVFESLAVRDLRVYAGIEGGRLYHYRDSAGLEADAILEYPDGSWAAVEVKLGMAAVDEAAAHLLALAAKVNTEAAGEPRALVVITGDGFAYRRKDGVYVVPLQTLRP